MRALCYKVAEQIDIARHGADEATRTSAQEMVDLLIPLTKSYCTDVAETVTSIGIQVHGGMGFIEETGAAQHYRDAKITQIYEGTNGIQAMDLVGRKLPDARRRRLPGPVRPHAFYVGVTWPGTISWFPWHRELAAALDALEDATNWILSEGLADPVQALSAATPYQRLFATTVAGWLMAQQALAAVSVAEGTSGAEFRPEAKLVTARFFAEHLLPQVHGLVAPVKAGKTDLFAVDRRPVLVARRSDQRRARELRLTARAFGGELNLGVEGPRCRRSRTLDPEPGLGRAVLSSA
jgi:hypothetical protein